ncbi:Transcriptional regulator, TrmB (fragment) [Nitrolancea hollandica Lb]|uniref:Transcriptional regulator, TrmB n=1 Tax=Nitrolancea hollandica Lb TaxID=1129897 RepID=I4EK35_9BACT
MATLLETAEQVLSDVAKGIYECARYDLPGNDKP